MSALVRVLLADDQVAFRRAARTVLDATSGFELVGEVTSGEDALALLPALQADLVLMDVRMPGIGGIEATRRIARLHPETTIVLVSTYRHEDLPRDAWTCGAVEYVHKEDLSSDTLTRVWSALNPPGRRGRRARP